MKRGFTLIELLAVIIILAIVAIIATPIVLNVVNDAKESAAKSTTYNIIDGAKMYYAESMFDNSKKAKLTGAANIYDDILFNGKKPENGQLYVNKKGLVAVAIVINNKCYKKEFAGELQITEDNECNVGVTADNISPTVSLSVVETSFNDNGWANKDFYVNIKVIDNETGGYSYMWCSGIDDCEPIALRENSSGKVLVSTESETSVVCIIGYDLAGNDSEKTCSEPYKLDKQKPVLTVTSEEIQIDQGTNVLVSSYFNVSYGISGGNLTCNPQNISSLNFGNQTITCTATSGSGLTEIVNKDIIVKEKRLFKIDTSGANSPILFDNMIAIAYEGTNWIRVNASQRDWYSYDQKAWANAAVLNSGVTKNVGDIINVATEVSLMFVWIPRYKYTIFNGNNGSVPVQEINISFESEKNLTGTVKCNDNILGSCSTSEICSDSTNGSIVNGTSTYTHPAFCFGHRTNGICDGNELTGFWVGKFETSAPNVTSNSVQKVTIKPNVISWRRAKIVNFYTSIANISSNYEINFDSHLMKNMEWGAVAYLTQSKYGRCTNGTCTEVSKNDSSGSYTGRSQGIIPPTSSKTTNGTYTYEKVNGQKASTTNNIYGVYDMGGGAVDFVMGNMNSGGNFNTYSSGFSSAPPSKYYDLYSRCNDSTIDTIHSVGKLGDATKETMSNYGNRVGGWYKDNARMTHWIYPWFTRGSSYGASTESGIFTFNKTGGNFESSDVTVRAVGVSLD